MRIRREVVWTIAGFMVYEFIISPLRMDAVLHEHLAEDFFQGPPVITNTSVNTFGGISTTTTTTAPP